MQQQKYQGCYNFHFQTVNVKFYHNTKLCMPKYFMFYIFRLLHFWWENDVSKLAPKLFISIMGYLMIVSERTSHKELKPENIFEIGRPNEKISRCKF